MTELEVQEKYAKKNIFFVKGEITPKLADVLIGLILINMLQNDGKTPITIIIDSKGGEVRPALTIYDFLKSLKVEVRGIVIGKCSSAALIVFAGCTKRQCLPNSAFFYHSTTFTRTIKSNVNNLEETMKNVLDDCEEIQKRKRDVQIKNFNVTVEKLAELERRGEESNYDIYAEEAKNLGIIHEVIEKFDW